MGGARLCAMALLGAAACAVLPVTQAIVPACTILVDADQGSDKQGCGNTTHFAATTTTTTPCQTIQYGLSQAIRAVSGGGSVTLCLAPTEFAGSGNTNISLLVQPQAGPTPGVSTTTAAAAVDLSIIAAPLEGPSAARPSINCKHASRGWILETTPTESPLEDGVGGGDQSHVTATAAAAAAAWSLTIAGIDFFDCLSTVADTSAGADDDSRPGFLNSNSAGGGGGVGGDGGALRFVGASLTLDDVTFTGCSAGTSSCGGAVAALVGGSGGATFSNCSFTACTAPLGGGAVYVATAGTAVSSSSPSSSSSLSPAPLPSSSSSSSSLPTSLGGGSGVVDQPLPIPVSVTDSVFTQNQVNGIVDPRGGAMVINCTVPVGGVLTSCDISIARSRFSSNNVVSCLLYTSPSPRDRG